MPLLPAPSCAFVLLPISEADPDGVDPGDISGIVQRLRRGAEIAHIAPGVFAGVSERARPGLDRLTTRELEIVTRLLDGQRPPAIARSLFLSQSTVRNHLGSVFATFEVTSQQELLDLLRTRTGVRDPPCWTSTNTSGSDRRLVTPAPAWRSDLEDRDRARARPARRTQ